MARNVMAGSLGLLLCSAATSAPAQTPRIHDSADVRIVENPSMKTAPIAFRLGAQPLVDLGAPDAAHPEATFDPGDGYLAAVRLGNGLIAVSDNHRSDGAAWVKYFDASGKYLKTVDRYGRPAEMVYVTTLCRTRGDTVIVNDVQNFAFGVIDEKGSFVRYVPLGGAIRGNIAPQACLSDGSVLVTYEALPDAGNFRPMAHYVALRTDGTIAHDFGMMPGTKYGAVSREVQVTAVRDTLFVADGLGSEVRVYSIAGKLVRIIRTNDPIVPITPEDIKTGVGFNTMGATHEPAGPIPPDWPAYTHVMQDPAGRLWVQDAVPRQPRDWTAFDAAGRLLGRFALPARPAGERWDVVAFGANEVEIRSYTRGGGAHLLFYPLVPVGTP